MRNGIFSMRYAVMHVVVAVMDMMSRPERAVVVVMMESIAVMPIPVIRPAAVYIPPTRIISPVPRTVPCAPCGAPEPIVDNRPVDIYRLDDIVRAIYVLIAHNLNAYIVRFVFLHVYRGYVLEDILCEDGLQHHQTLVTFAYLNNPQIIHLSVAVQV